MAEVAYSAPAYTSPYVTQARIDAAEFGMGGGTGMRYYTEGGVLYGEMYLMLWYDPDFDTWAGEVIDDFGAEDGTSDLSNELILAHVYSGYSIGVINGFSAFGGLFEFEDIANVAAGFCLSEEPAEEPAEEAPEEAAAQEGSDDDKESSTEGEPGAVCFYLESEGITEDDEEGNYNYQTKVRGWSMTPEEWKNSKDAGNINNINYDDIMDGGFGAIAGINAFSHWKFETNDGAPNMADFGHVQKKLPMCYDSILEEFGVIYENAEGELAEAKDSWPYDAAWEKGTKLQLWAIKSFNTNELVQLVSYENEETYV